MMETDTMKLEALQAERKQVFSLIEEYLKDSQRSKYYTVTKNDVTTLNFTIGEESFLLHSHILVDKKVIIFKTYINVFDPNAKNSVYAHHVEQLDFALLTLEESRKVSFFQKQSITSIMGSESRKDFGRLDYDMVSSKLIAQNYIDALKMYLSHVYDEKVEELTTPPRNLANMF